MDKVSIALVKLLAASTGCSESVNIDLDQTEWEKLYSDAVAHQVDSIIYMEASKYGSSLCPDLFTRWRSNTIMQVLRHNAGLSVIGEIIRSLEDKGVPVMVLKGFHYKHLYEDPDMRMMSDVDLLTERDALTQASDIIQSFGYKKVKGDDPKHIPFVHKGYIAIELHFALFTESKRRIATDFNKEIWESAYYFEKDGLKFLVPSYINQLIYCCIHMTNHFGEGGFGLRQLSDFNLLAKHCCGHIDWDQLLRKSHMYGIGKFIEVMLFICHELFALNIPETLVNRYRAQKEYVDSFVNMILDSGAFGGKDAKAQANRIIASYINAAGSGFLSKFSYIFPSREKLMSSYPYVQKYGFLVPVAWIHRLFKNILRKDISLSQKIPDSKEVDGYVRIFRWLDIRRNN